MPALGRHELHWQCKDVRHRRLGATAVVGDGEEMLSVAERGGKAA